MGKKNKKTRKKQPQKGSTKVRSSKVNTIILAVITIVGAAAVFYLSH